MVTLQITQTNFTQSQVFYTPILNYKNLVTPSALEVILQVSSLSGDEETLLNIVVQKSIDGVIWLDTNAFEQVSIDSLNNQPLNGSQALVIDNNVARTLPDDENNYDRRRYVGNQARCKVFLTFTNPSSTNFQISMLAK